MGIWAGCLRDRRTRRFRCDLDKELFFELIETLCRVRMQLARHTRKNIAYNPSRDLQSSTLECAGH